MFVYPNEQNINNCEVIPEVTHYCMVLSLGPVNLR